MAFKKRESAAISAAKTRSAELKAIQPDGKLDLGNGHTHEALDAQIKKTSEALEAYNTSLTTSDKLGNIVTAEEKKLSRLSSDILTGVGQRFGTDSDEYEQAGGTRDSERKKPVRKPKDAPKG